MSDTQNKVRCECKNCHDIYHLDPAAIYNPYCPACQKCDSLEFVERKLEYELRSNNKGNDVDAHAFTRKREKEIMDELAGAALNSGIKKHYADDPVNHPKHYNDHPSGVECITITRHMGFNIGNAIKYLWRAGRKGKDFEIQDLRKAVWHIEDEIKRLEANNG